MKNSYSLDEIIVNAAKIEEEYFEEALKIGGHGANFSKFFGLKRIGVHLFRIPVGYRTSRPHAEKCEDEFVYVVAGEIDCWVNGRIKKMRAGDSIGFPAGTGVGHSFINNSEAEVLLFVVGERTKSENQYHFHLEPDLQKERKDQWWSDVPKHVLGGHDGMPGHFDDSLLDNSISTLNAFDSLQEAKDYSYPGDSETFGFGVCLSREFKINTFAVWLERLPSGKRSAWPHAHSVEEEFILVLKGKPHLWLNNEEIELKEFDAVDFKAGSGLAHVVLNKTHEDIYYLCVGECEPKNDLIYYPLHPKRNEEVKEKGRLWSNCPQNVKII